METIEEKKTIKGSPNEASVNDKVQYLRFWARLIISVLVFGVYFFICWSLFQASQEELSDSVRSIMQILVGAGADESIHDNVPYAVTHRAPWLLVNLITASIAATVISFFET